MSLTSSPGFSAGEERQSCDQTDDRQRGGCSPDQAAAVSRSLAPCLLCLLGGLLCAPLAERPKIPGQLRRRGEPF